MSEDGRSSADRPYRPPQELNWGNRLDVRLRKTVPRPGYERLLGGYHGLRRLVGRNPGRGGALPDFVILGAAKAGTTSLFSWLVDHPFVQGARHKEVNFFSYNYYRGVDWYRQHFPLERDRSAFAAEHGRPFCIGESSPSYLLHEWAPERLHEVLPGAKLIVQLRNPVDRAYSQFQMRRRDGEEPLESFAAAVEAEDGRLGEELTRMLADKRYSSLEVACWSYLMRSRYAEQLDRWFRHFSRHQFHFLTLEDLTVDPQRVLDGVHSFLELPARCPDQLQARFAFDYDPMPRETRTMLEQYFRPHNERLYELLGTDFGWGKPAESVAATSENEL